jgi:hypothetical protein
MQDYSKTIHELNNKLCVISAHAELLKMTEPLSETGMQRVTDIVESISHCAILLRFCGNKTDMKEHP